MMYHQKTYSSNHPATNEVAEPYLLFEKFPNEQKTNDEGIVNTVNKSVSTPVSVERSAYMDENTKNIATEEGLYPSNFSPKSRRMSASKAERRAEHNAIERARRECLNSKFQQLARALPNLQNHRRPSKGQIVEKALDWVRQNMSKEDRYQYQILQLQNENKRLLDEINMVKDQTKRNSTMSPMSSASSSSPMNVSHPTDCPSQQIPVDSTRAVTIHNNHTLPAHNNVGISTYYHHQQENEHIPVAYPMAPLNVDWNQSHRNISSNPRHGPSEKYMMPNKSLATLGFGPLEDDNDSSSSSEEFQQAHQAQILYNHIQQCTLFDMNQQVAESNASWDFLQPAPQLFAYHHPEHTSIGSQASMYTNTTYLS
ncbi:MAG: hypothetical protein EXX96DRAFT_185553 [Benjaminiella poitrasii]|nr:MAG: hypothetical protein EXX96DRAFT_185553 [Benjaminiella poitrasii]